MPEWFEFRNFLFLVLFSIFEGVGGVESQFSCLVSGDSGDLCFNGLNFAISKVVSQERGEFRSFDYGEGGRSVGSVRLRGVAQFGSALGSGPRGRRFKSSRPDTETEENENRKSKIEDRD